MKIKNSIVAAVSMVACAGVLAGGLRDGLGDYPFGKKRDQVQEAIVKSNGETLDACTTGALRKLYSKYDVSCEALVVREPVMVGGLAFYPEFAFSEWGDRLVAVIYRSTHRFASKTKSNLEMSAGDLVAAAVDRDYMIARNSAFRALGDVSKMQGRKQVALQPGLRIVKYYFSGEKDYMVFREHTTEEEDRITIVAMPKDLGAERRVFLSEAEEKRFFGDNK